MVEGKGGRIAWHPANSNTHTPSVLVDNKHTRSPGMLAAAWAAACSAVWCGVPTASPRTCPLRSRRRRRRRKVKASQVEDVHGVHV